MRPGDADDGACDPKRPGHERIGVKGGASACVPAADGCDDCQGRRASGRRPVFPAQMSGFVNTVDRARIQSWEQVEAILYHILGNR